MGIIKVDGSELKVGRLVLALRRQHDTAPDATGTKSGDAFRALVAPGGNAAARKTALGDYGITERIKKGRKVDDIEEEPIDGDEIFVVFDDKAANQTIPAAGASNHRTIMVIPAEADIYDLWNMKPGDRPTKQDIEELGRYVLKRCR